MTHIPPRFIFAMAALSACTTPLAAQRWQMQYLHDEPKSILNIVDLQFSSASRGVAVGVTTNIAGKNRKDVALLTHDGGAHWETVALKGDAGALFLLNDLLGWMASGKSLWRITESGKTWQRLPNPPERVERVYFKDENNGWAACQNKSVLETHDGGKKWTKVAAAAEQPGDEATTAYKWIAFATPEAGVITGWNPPPPRVRRLPDWMEPEAIVRTREVPRLNLILSTGDGGKSWKSSSVSMFGEITRMRFGPNQETLALIEHAPSFQFPSEVARLLSNKSEMAYRDPKVFITDLWITPRGTCYIAGVSANDKVRLVPQKVRVFSSNDLKTWTPVPVDYRAVSNRVILTGTADGSLWMATDNGMILKLSEK